jgi:hypothetical protein
MIYHTAQEGFSGQLAHQRQAVKGVGAVLICLCLLHLFEWTIILAGWHPL